jgi:predicted Zn-dependent protease
MTDYVALLRKAKEFNKAQTVLQAVLARDPKNDQVKGDLIRVEADIGGMRAGLAKARSFAKEDPGNPHYDIVCAQVYEEAGRRETPSICSKRQSLPGRLTAP